MLANRKISLSLPVIAVLFMVGPGPSAAQIISGTITGEVILNSMGVSGVAVGDPVTGTYSYDASVILTDPFGRLVNPLTAFTLTIDSLPHTFTLADLQPDLVNRERLIAYSTPTVDSIEFFPDFGVAAGALGYPILTETVKFVLPQWYRFQAPQGNLDFNFQATPVPEPGSLALLIAAITGAAGLALRRRRCIAAARQGGECVRPRSTPEPNAWYP